MKKTLVLLTIFLGLLSSAFTEDNRQKKILEIQIDLGAGFYLGSFRDHLKTDGAYTVSPTLDITIAPYLWHHCGIQVCLGGGTVIHPQSEPIEGVVFYFGIGPFFTWSRDKLHFKFFTEAGYQNPNMTLQWYGSGFWKIGSSVGWDVTKESAIRFSITYKRQFLQSLIIHEQYSSLSENDNMNSLSLSIGYTVYFYSVFPK